METTLNNVANFTTSHRFEGRVPEEVLDVSSLGQGLELLSRKAVLFDHGLAQKLLGLKQVPWERGLRDAQVSFLISEMKKATFLHELANLASCILEPTGDEYRINGQHTCWARTYIAEAEYPPQNISVLKYKAATEDDMRRLYASFDRGAARTRGNVLSAYLSGTTLFEDCSPTLIRILASGLAFWLWESAFERSQHTADDVAFLMQRDHAFVVQTVASFCNTDPKVISIPLLRRSATFAAMLETFSKTVKHSEEFWHSIRVGIGFSSMDDPRLRLRNHLQTHVNSKMLLNKENNKKHIDAESMYRWCISAWNAWRSGETLKHLRTTSKRVRAK